MTDAVENIVRSAAQTDPSITPTMLTLALEALKGVRLVHVTGAGTPCEAEDLPPVVPRLEVARFLKRKLNLIDHMARKGVLVKVYGCGSKRGIGFTRESVRNVLAGLSKGRCYGKRR